MNQPLVRDRLRRGAGAGMHRFTLPEAVSEPWPKYWACRGGEAKLLLVVLGGLKGLRAGGGLGWGLASATRHELGSGVFSTLPATRQGSGDLTLLGPGRKGIRIERNGP